MTVADVPIQTDRQDVVSSVVLFFPTEAPEAFSYRPQRLVLYACSILRSGVAIAPVSGRSNDELLRALSITLDAALPEAAGDEGGGPGEGEEDAMGCWAVSKDGGPATTVHIPDPAVDLKEGGIGVGLEDCCKEAQRQNLDVTAKFFYLTPPMASPLDPARYDPHSPGEAMEELERATGLEDVDTMVVSLPGFTYDDRPSTGCDSEIQAAGHAATDDEFLDIWKVRRALQRIGPGALTVEGPQGISSDRRFRSLGVSDFSKSRIERIYPHLAPRTPPGSGTSLNGASRHHPLPRRPRVNQINTRTEVPDELRQLARSEGLQLFTHSDCSDILPPKTFALLMNKYAHRMPPPLVEAMAAASMPSSDGQEGQRDVRLHPKWVLKYTVVIRDRGVIADKGYIVNVSSV